MTKQNTDKKLAASASKIRVAATIFSLTLLLASGAADAARNNVPLESPAAHSARDAKQISESIGSAASHEAYVRAAKRIAEAEREMMADADATEAPEKTAILSPQDVAVFSPAGQFAGETRFEDGVTLVDAAAFARFAGADDVSSDGASLRACGGGFDVTLTAGTEYVESSGRCFWTRRTLEFEGETVFAPISPLAAAFGFSAEGDGVRTVRLTGGGAIVPAAAYYDENDLCWLSHIINAESGCEPFSGKIAVGNVVLNRVRSAGYPDSVYGVIFDFTYGVQFTPAANGTVYLEPSADAVAAAKVCLEGYSLSDEIAFFFNPAIAESSWISDNRPWVMTIGRHAFYS